MIDLTENQIKALKNIVSAHYKVQHLMFIWEREFGKAPQNEDLIMFYERVYGKPRSHETLTRTRRKLVEQGLFKNSEWAKQVEITYRDIYKKGD